MGHVVRIVQNNWSSRTWTATCDVNKYLKNYENHFAIFLDAYLYLNGFKIRKSMLIKNYIEFETNRVYTNLTMQIRSR